MSYPLHDPKRVLLSISFKCCLEQRQELTEATISRWEQLSQSCTFPPICTVTHPPSFFFSPLHVSLLLRVPFFFLNLWHSWLFDFLFYDLPGKNCLVILTASLKHDLQQCFKNQYHGLGCGIMLHLLNSPTKFGYKTWADSVPQPQTRRTETTQTQTSNPTWALRPGALPETWYAGMTVQCQAQSSAGPAIPGPHLAQCWRRKGLGFARSFP